ncbi:MAG TPA: hypothetical protein DD473_13065 [Planctomycetaceae bacterium]|nr:hypothetical protein [Planctomycetaceae bacterium]
MSRTTKNSTPKATSKPRLGVAERLEKETATRAYRKVMAGETVTAEERSALKRYEKQQEEERRWQYYESIPQKHWREMSGRQTKVLHEQAEKYGIPFGEKTINLPRVVRSLHDFLAANARRLSEDDDLLDAAISSPALERYREERAILAKLDRLEREGQLIPRDEIRLGLGQIAAILRTAGEMLQRQFGNDAVEILNDGLEEAERCISKICDRDAPSSDEDQSS